MSETNFLGQLALVVSCVSLALSSIALWPQYKERFVAIRDAILWIALVAVGLSLFMPSLFAPRRDNSQEEWVPNNSSYDEQADANDSVAAW